MGLSQSAPVTDLPVVDQEKPFWTTEKRFVASSLLQLRIREDAFQTPGWEICDVLTGAVHFRSGPNNVLEDAAGEAVCCLADATGTRHRKTYRVFPGPRPADQQHLFALTEVSHKEGSVTTSNQETGSMERLSVKGDWSKAVGIFLKDGTMVAKLHQRKVMEVGTGESGTFWTVDVAGGVDAALCVLVALGLADLRNQKD